MRTVHRLVVALGVFSCVGLVTLAGTTAQASNYRTAEKGLTLKAKIQRHNQTANGCQE